MSTKFDARQAISRDLLNRLATASGTELDNLLRSINLEVTPPLALSANSPASLIVNVGAAVLTNPETGRKNALPSIGANTPSITSATITFPAASGGNITTSTGGVTLLTVASGNWIKGLVYLDGNDGLNVLLGTEGASEAAATITASPDGTMPIGFISVHNVGGVIQVIPDTQIYQFGGAGGGSGGGSGSDVLAAIRDMLSDSHLDITAAVVARTAQATVLHGSSTAAFNIVNNTYKFTSAAQTVVTVNLASQAEFLDLVKPLNKVDLCVFWYAGAVDTAATYEVSRNGGTNWQTITMERVGVGTPAYRGFLELDLENTSSIPLNIVNTGVQVEMDNGTARAKISQQLTLGSRTTINNAGFELKKAGTITGSYRFAIYGNSAGSPDETNKLWISPWFDVASLTTSLTLTQAAVSLLVDLSAATYHLVLETDSVYQAAYSAGVNYLAVGRNNTVALNEADNATSAPVWSAQTYDYAAKVNGKIYANQTLNTQAADNTSSDLNVTDRQKLSQKFTVPANASNVFREIELKIAKANSTVAGYFKFSIVRDDSTTPGQPSTAVNDVVAESALTSVSSLSTGTNTVNLSVSWQLGAGDYHIVVTTDAAYKARYTATSGVDKLSVRTQSATTPDSRKFNGTNWNTATGDGAFYHVLRGISLDLRVRITSSAGSKEIEAFAITYDEPVAVPVSDVREVQYFDFSGDLGTTDFVVNNFNVNPELVKVHDVYEGKIYNYGIFATAGNRLVFPAGFFLRPGEQVRLKVEQFDGGSYDNSDQNSRLLATQHFASPPGSNLPNFGLPGRGFYQMRTDGKIYECVIRIVAGVPVGWDFYEVT